MLTILLIRTGATEYETQGRIQGTLDVPLSEDGRQQVERAANELAEVSASLSALYVGPGRSAQQTAEIISHKLDVKPKTVENLRNLDHGLWQGMLVDEVKTKQPKVYRKWNEQPDTVCPPQGETLQGARQRLQKVIDRLTKRHKSGAVAIVASPPIASLLRSMLRDDQVTEIWKSPDKAGPLWEPIPLVSTT